MMRHSLRPGLAILLFIVLYTPLLFLAPRPAAAGLLQDGDFEAGTGNQLTEPWQIKNDQLGLIEVKRSDAVRGARTLHVRLNEQSDYGTTIVVSQVINVEGLRGKVLSYGGDAKTLHARIFFRLWTPNGNGEIEVKGSPAFTNFRGTFKVPAEAPYLLLGVEAVGERGGEIWVDNLFVEEMGAAQQAAKVVAAAATGAGQADMAILTIDPNQRMGRISPLKFGGHVEWINAGHGLWDVKGNKLDRQALDLLRQLRIPLWRFPGGIYSDYYHWQDGLADPANRPLSMDPFDKETQHRHDLGVKEFIEFLKNTNSEALITANYGTGSKEEAMAWLKHFRDQGVKARYWEIGNEVYMADPDDAAAANGARIFHPARQYADDFGEWAAALKSVDSDIMVGAIGGVNNTHPSNRGWMDTLLKTAGGQIDFIALHNAFAPIIMGSYDYSSESNRRQAYRAMLAQVEDFKADVALTKKKLKTHQPSRANTIKIAITEHFPIFGDLNSENREQYVQNIDQTRTVAGAIYSASLLIAIVSDPQIFMANYLNPIHQYFSAFLNVSAEGLIKNPVYYVYYMFRNYFGEELVFSRMESPTFSTPALGMVPAIANAPLVDGVVATSADGTISVALVNKDLEAPRPVQINLQGVGTLLPAELDTLKGSVPNAVTAPPLSKTTSRQPEMAIEHSALQFTSGQVLILPPASCSILRIHP